MGVRPPQSYLRDLRLEASRRRGPAQGRGEALGFQAPREEVVFARAEEAAGTASVWEAAGHRSLKGSTALPCFFVASGRVTTFRLGGVGGVGVWLVWVWLF